MDAFLCQNRVHFVYNLFDVYTIATQIDNPVPVDEITRTYFFETEITRT